jgi:hypothetical protein
MDSVVDGGSQRFYRPLKPGTRMSKTYLGCRLVRQLDGTVKVWAPVYGVTPFRWDLVRVASSMKSAHNFVHNTRAKKG